MDKINLSDIKKAHFIGIGGISMSGLAQILHAGGVCVTGSDISSTPLITHMENIGIKIYIGHNSQNVPSDCQLVVYTVALADDNPELLAAKAHNITIIDRAELLGLIMGGYKHTIGVSGTHGKTTTSSLISELLLKANYDPTLQVGGILSSINSNFRIGKSDYFVAEADEYFDSFSKFYPHIGVILNIDNDHTDYFKSEDQIRNSFRKFMSNIAPDGFLIACNSIQNLDELVKNLECNVITYGEGGDYSARDIKYSTDGKSDFDIYYKNDFVTNISLNLAGGHNVENALAAFAAGRVLGISPEVMGDCFAHFSGAKRRFEKKGIWRGVRIIDDYAHHPTEIIATLSAAKKCEHEKIYTVFQPHTFSRTKAFLDGFAEALSASDVTVLLDIYSARESHNSLIHSKDLALKMAQLGAVCHYFDSFNAAKDFLKANCAEGDMLITMGAGDVFKLGEQLLGGD